MLAARPPFTRARLRQRPRPGAVHAGLLIALALTVALPAAAQEGTSAGGPEEGSSTGDETGVRQDAPDDGDVDRDDRLDLQRREADESARAEQLAAREPAAEAAAGDHALATESAQFREAYAQLVRAETSGKTDGLDPVKDLFKKEIDEGRNLARSYNGLGRYYLQQHEHAITILESIQKLFNWDHITQARKNFRLATEADPSYLEAWYNWGVAGRKAADDDALREAAAAFRQAVRLDPAYRDAYRQLVVTLRDLGDVEGSQAALAEWRASSTGSPSLANLEESFLKMGLEKQPAAGAKLYWEGLAAAQTGDEADAYFEQLKWIVPPKQVEVYRGLEADAKRGWIEGFWQREADAALVGRDERLAEHYRRLAYVQDHYSLRIPQRRHYSAISAYRPKQQSGFDDRGIIYLRHGEPDDVARFTGANVQRNESWLYRRPGDDLVFHFVSDEDTEDFKLVTSLADALNRGNTSLAAGRNTAENAGDLFTSRSTFDPIYDRLAFQFNPMLLREEEEDVARDVKVGTTTASYVPPSADSLPFYAFPAVFRDAAGNPEVSLYFGVPTSALQMPEGPEGTRMAYGARMLIEEPGSGDSVAAREADSVIVAVQHSPSRDQGVLIPDVLRSGLPSEPHDYRYRLRVRDLISTASGTLTGEFEAPDLSGFSASTLLLASRVEPSGEAGKFNRGGFKVVPLPSLTFRAGQPVYLYYELYGMTAGEDGRYRTHTQYTIRTRERKRNIAVKLLNSVGSLVGSGKERGEEVGIEVDGEGASADRVAETLALDMNDSEPGLYEIEVRVEDRTSGRKVERRAPFVLVK
jgi:GWxTD domain-containing protein